MHQFAINRGIKSVHQLYANLRNNKNHNLRVLSAQKFMINFKLADGQGCFSKLTDQLLRTDRWALINNNGNGTLIKQIATGKIYQLVSNQIFNNSCIQQQNCNIDVQDYCEENVSVDNNSIFLQKIRLTNDYYLTQKSIMTLSDRIMRNRTNIQPTLYTEKEILQTFMPIIKSICQKQIPSFYQLTSNFVHMDSNQNIRLTNYNTAMFYTNKMRSDTSFNLFQQMAILIMESALLKSTQETIKLMESEEAIVLMLIQRHYSYQIIGLIFILINQTKNSLPITMSDFIRQGFNLSWFDNLRINIQKRFKTFKQKNQHPPKKTRKTVQCSQEQTEDSSMIMLTKYRSGIRVQKLGINNQNYQQLNDEIYYNRHLKARKRQYQTGFD